MRKPIVIIGGMGPQASLRFHELLIEKSKQYHSGDGDEFPLIVHFSLPIEDFISDRSKMAAAADHLNKLDAVIRQLKPQAVTLACNTAHLLGPSVGFMGRQEFVSMIDSVAIKLKDQGIKRVGLLASPTTIRTKLYENVLGKRGIMTIVPSNDQSSTTEDAIRAVIAGENDISLSNKLAGIANSLIDDGAETILLGCTELPLIFEKRLTSVPVLDCLDIYAAAVIDQYYLYNGS